MNRTKMILAVLTAGIGLILAGAAQGQVAHASGTYGAWAGTTDGDAGRAYCLTSQGENLAARDQTNSAGEILFGYGHDVVWTRWGWSWNPRFNDRVQFNSATQLQWCYSPQKHQWFYGYGEEGFLGRNVVISDDAPISATWVYYEFNNYTGGDIWVPGGGTRPLDSGNTENVNIKECAERGYDGAYVFTTDRFAYGRGSDFQFGRGSEISGTPQPTVTVGQTTAGYRKLSAMIESLNSAKRGFKEWLDELRASGAADGADLVQSYVEFCNASGTGVSEMSSHCQLGAYYDVGDRSVLYDIERLEWLVNNEWSDYGGMNDRNIVDYESTTVYFRRKNNTDSATVGAACAVQQYAGHLGQNGAIFDTRGYYPYLPAKASIYGTSYVAYMDVIYPNGPSYSGMYSPGGRYPNWETGGGMFNQCWAGMSQVASRVGAATATKYMSVKYLTGETWSGFTDEELYNKYSIHKAWQNAKDHGAFAGVENLDVVATYGDSNLRWFCYGEDSLYAQSFVEITTTGGLDKNANTAMGTQGEIKEASVETSDSEKATVGETVTVKFGHDMYADKPRCDGCSAGGNVEHAIERTVTRDGVELSTETILGAEATTAYKEENGDAIALATETTIDGKRYYWAAWTRNWGAPADGVGGERRGRGDSYNITFGEPGTYEVCEKFYVEELQYTRVCAKIIVEGVGLFGQSAVDVTNLAASKTPLTTVSSAPTSATATVPAALDEGETIEVKFGHSAYATQAMMYDDNVNLTVKRLVRQNGSEYSLTSFFGSDISAVDGTNSKLDDSTDYGEHSLYEGGHVVDGNEYYWWPWPPNFDVNGVEYERGDAYDITLNKEGLFEICEQLYINGDYYTEACAKVQVGVMLTYYAESTVMATSSTGGSARGTATRTSTTSTAYATTTALQGGTATVIFTHSAYANKSAANTAWKVAVSAYHISGVTTTPRTGTVDLTALDDSTGLYVADAVPTSMSPRGYTLTFPSAGTYVICQTLSVGPDTLPWTMACAKIVVTPPESDLGMCTNLAPPSYLDSNASAGTSSVLAKVKFTSASSGSSTYANPKPWTNELWAKPSDSVTWIHCYYPGAQTVASTEVSIRHGGHDYGYYRTTNANMALWRAVPTLYGRSWGNSRATVASSINPTQVPTFCAGPLAGYSGADSWETFNGGCTIYNQGVSPATILQGSTGNYEIKAKSDTYEIGQGKRTMVGGSRTGGNIDRAGHTLVETITMDSTTPSYAKAATPGDSHNGYGRWIYYCGRYRCYYTSHTNRYLINQVVRWNGSTSNAQVKIPYNYNNTSYDDPNNPSGGENLPGAEVKFADDDPKIDDGGDYPEVKNEEPKDTDGNELGVVYSGETIRVETAKVTVSPRKNSKVCDSLREAGLSSNDEDCTYATQVDNAQVKMIAYVAEQYESESKIVDIGNSASGLCGNITNKGLCQIVNSMANNEDLDGNGVNDTLTLNVNGSLAGAVHDGSCSASTTGGSGADTLCDLKGDGTGESDHTTNVFASTYNVFDADAGDYFCMAIAVYPAYSGDASNLNAAGSNSWYISKPDCRIIAKRPSLQVWGGSVYSNGSMRTISGIKHNVYGVYDYHPFESFGVINNTTLFGSWGEQSITSLESVTGFASGAAMGLASDTQNLVKSGNRETSPNYCKNQTTLSFANYGSSDICDNEQATGRLGITPAVPDREALVNYWLPEDRSASGTVASATGKTIEYTYSNGEDLTIGATNVGRDTTRVYYANAGSYDGNVIINGDIKYTSEFLSTAGNIPKVVIYASGDIKISCNVKQVDALLIAEGTVDTCYEAAGSDGVHGTDDDYPQKDSRRSKQLTIRGVVIADKMILGRTYGAAAGSKASSTAVTSPLSSDELTSSDHLANSAIPAEIVNYDTSAILWSSYMGGAAESDTMVTTYQRELAPRY